MASKIDQQEKMERMFAAAHSDPSLKRRLLSDPKAVAAEFGVELAAEEVERLSKLGTFVELVEEVKYGARRSCKPEVCYPSGTWLRAEAVSLVRELAPREDPQVYPPRYSVYRRPYHFLCPPRHPFYPPRYPRYPFYPPRYRYERPLYAVPRYPVRYDPIFEPRGYPIYRSPMDRLVGLRR